MDENGFTFPAQISIRPILSLREIVHQEQQRAQGLGGSAFTSGDVREATQEVSNPSRNENINRFTQHHRQRPPYPESTALATEAPSSSRTSYREWPREWQRDSDLYSRSTRIISSRPPNSHSSTRLNTHRASYESLKTLKINRDTGARTYLVQDRFTKTIYIEKRFAVAVQSTQNRAKAQENALARTASVTNSPDHIIRLQEAFNDNNANFSSLILEYCDHGNLSDFISRYLRESKSCPEAFAWHVLKSLASAICTCHYGTKDPNISLRRSEGWDPLFHLNITPDNVYLTSTYQYGFYPRVVLANFTCVATQQDIESGLAESVLREHANGEWLPPEAFESVGKLTDIWQLGATIQAICRLITTPDQALSDEARPCGRRFSPALNNIITCCMERDWKNRPTATELMGEVLRTSPPGKE